ncbi:MAG TPA: methyltransferase domain-containing protein [Candidatus Baltobacteraceae bacterium]|nr:methyltransferase domain-containing protein [Candidatus Baltobacteraceae bacterium]
MYYAGKAATAIASKALRPYFSRRYGWARREREAPRDDIVAGALASACIPVEAFTVRRERFVRWIREAQYSALAYVVNRVEKQLEHFVSIELLALPARGTLIDAASCRSPFPELMRARGYRVVAQDLSYPAGLHGDRLGGDAAAMELPSAFADGITLHCSFEHFEADADTRFVSTVGRILKPGARAVILPLYLSHTYTIETDPLVSRGKVPVDPGAQLVAGYGYANRFGRHYDAASLLARVLQPAERSGLNVTVVRVEHPDVKPAYLRFALILERPR